MAYMDIPSGYKSKVIRNFMPLLYEGVPMSYIYISHKKSKIVFVSAVR